MLLQATIHIFIAHFFKHYIVLGTGMFLCGAKYSGTSI